MKLSLCDNIESIRDQMPAYIAEMNRYLDDPEPGGDYPYLGHYWREPDRTPFLISSNNETCGFALLRYIRSGTQAPDYHSIAEFYIQPEHRRLGIGEQAVAELLNRYPGHWLIQVLTRNEPALAFWQRTLTELSRDGVAIEKGERFYDLTLSN